MPRDRQIKIIIAADGTCTVDALNFTGPSCRQATGEITAVLGGEIGHQRDKPEARSRAANDYRDGAAAAGDGDIGWPVRPLAGEGDHDAPGRLHDRRRHLDHPAAPSRRLGRSQFGRGQFVVA